MKAGSDLPVCPLLWSLGTIPSSLDQLLTLWQLVPYQCLLPGGETGFVVVGEPILESPWKSLDPCTPSVAMLYPSH